MDVDFDGCISKTDLKNFIKDVLEEKFLPETKLERIFAILDVGKSGRIFKNDFESIFHGPLGSHPRSFSESNLGRSAVGSMRNSTVGSLNFDWRVGATQQIGLFLSRSYPSIKESFNRKDY